MTIGVRDGALNKELPAIREELKELIEGGKADAYLYHLYGIVLRESQDANVMARVVETGRQRAVFGETSSTALVTSLNLFPWNWSAWLDLSVSITSEKHLAEVVAQLKPHLLVSFFQAQSLARLGHFTRALINAQHDYRAYPQLKHTLRTLAVTLTDSGLYADAIAHFEKLREMDPYDFDCMDQYAIALKETTAISELSKLATEATITSRWSTMACLIVSRFHYAQGALQMAVVLCAHTMVLDPGAARVWEAAAQPVFTSADLPRRIACLHNAMQTSPYNVRYKAQIGAAYVFRVPSHAYYNLGTVKTAEALEKEDWTIIVFSLDNQNSKSAKDLSKRIRAAIDPVTGHFLNRSDEQLIKHDLFKQLQESALTSFNVFADYVKQRANQSQIYREEEVAENAENAEEGDASIHTPARGARPPADGYSDDDDYDDEYFDDEGNPIAPEDLEEMLRMAQDDGEEAMELEGDEMEMEMDDDI